MSSDSQFTVRDSRTGEILHRSTGGMLALRICSMYESQGRSVQLCTGKEQKVIHCDYCGADWQSDGKRFNLIFQDEVHTVSGPGGITVKIDLCEHHEKQMRYTMKRLRERKISIEEIVKVFALPEQEDSHGEL